MPALNLAPRLSNLRLPFRSALGKAAQLGVRGVQLDAVGELSPSNLSSTGRREVIGLIRSAELKLVSVAVPMQRGFDDKFELEWRIDQVRNAMTLARDLGAGIATSLVGNVPSDQQSSEWNLLRDALDQIGRHGDHVGCVYAATPLNETGDALRALIDNVDTGSLGANLDPGWLVNHGVDPVVAAGQLAPLICHVHATDGIRKTALGPGQATPLGQGDVDYPELIGALEQTDYRGFLTLDRAPGPAAVEQAVAFLRQF